MVQKNSLNKLLIICGPTASGKSELAIKCAKKLNSEIISADSMQIFKKMNIGTAKILKEEMNGVPHHMIDIVNPNEKFSVDDYKKIALPIIENLINKNKIPIICGGTGFYIDSILYTKSLGNAGENIEIRKKYQDILKSDGKEKLYSLLQKVDFESSLILHINDTKRIIRALEIYELTGKKKSEQNDTLIPNFSYDAYSYIYNREILYEKINNRVDIMLNKGLVTEVENLLNEGLTEKSQSMQAIGYKEVVCYLRNEYNRSTMSDIIKQNSRNYAKRQITYFNKMQNLNYLDPKDNIDEIVEKIIKHINN